MSLKTNLEALMTRVGTEFKTLRIMISGTGTGDVSGLSTTANNIVGAINEVKTTADNNTSPGDTDALTEGATNLYYTDARADARVLATIDDAGAAAGNKLWSSAQTQSKITQDVAAALEGEDLSDLAAQVTANAASDSNMLSFGGAQSLTLGQKTQGQDNLGVYDKAELGVDIHTVDYVVLFNNALT